MAHQMISSLRIGLPSRGSFQEQFTTSVQQLLGFIEVLCSPTCHKGKRFEDRLLIIENIIDLPHTGTFFGRLNHCLDQTYGTNETELAHNLCSIIPCHGKFNKQFQTLVLQLIALLEKSCDLASNNNKHFMQRLVSIEKAIGLPQSGTFFYRLNNCSENLYGYGGDQFCIAGLVITSDMEALQHLEVYLNIPTNPSTDKYRRLQTIEQLANFQRTSNNFIVRLHKALEILPTNNLPNNNNN